MLQDLTHHRSKGPLLRHLIAEVKSRGPSSVHDHDVPTGAKR